MRSDDAQDVADGNDARHAERFARVEPVGTRIDDDKAAQTSIVLAHEGLSLF